MYETRHISGRHEEFLGDFHPLHDGIALIKMVSVTAYAELRSSYLEKKSVHAIAHSLAIDRTFETVRFVVDLFVELLVASEAVGAF